MLTNLFIRINKKGNKKEVEKVNRRRFLYIHKEYT